MSLPRIQIVEVGMRDGFQSVAVPIPTPAKIDILRRLYDAGLRRFEATSFVSLTAVPQLADAAEVLAAAQSLEGCDPQVLVPTARHAERALAAGARHLAFVLSVSEAHNRSNVGRTPAESATEFGHVAGLAPPGMRIRLNIATAFDCPFGGPVAAADTLALLDRLIRLAPKAEIALCDTTGRVAPEAVKALFDTARQRFPAAGSWAFHGHDTYGMGIANVHAAWRSGVSVIDASVAGLGGCPFAPGATGNVATEDVIYLFEKIGVHTGIALDALIDAAGVVARIPGASLGGRVRQAIESARLRTRCA